MELKKTFTLEMNTEDAAVFHDVLSKEVKVLIDGYDPETGREPGLNRQMGMDDLKNVLKRFDAIYKNTDKSYIMCLYGTELTEIRRLLKRNITSVEKEMAVMPDRYEKDSAADIAHRRFDTLKTLFFQVQFRR